MKSTNRKIMRSGQWLLIFSLLSRSSVVLVLCLLAMLTEYLNLKIAYNHPRLVELSSGPAMRVFYESADSFLSIFGDRLFPQTCSKTSSPNMDRRQ